MVFTEEEVKAIVQIIREEVTRIFQTGMTVTAEADAQMNGSKPAFKPASETQSPTKPEPKPKIAEDFPPSIREVLTFTQQGRAWIIKSKEYLKPNDFREILDTAQALGGKYVSAGKDSHFEIPL